MVFLIAIPDNFDKRYFMYYIGMFCQLYTDTLRTWSKPELLISSESHSFTRTYIYR